MGNYKCLTRQSWFSITHGHLELDLSRGTAQPHRTEQRCKRVLCLRTPCDLGIVLKTSLSGPFTGARGANESVREPLCLWGIRPYTRDEEGESYHTCSGKLCLAKWRTLLLGRGIGMLRVGPIEILTTKWRFSRSLSLVNTQSSITFLAFSAKTVFTHAQ